MCQNQTQNRGCFLGFSYKTDFYPPPPPLPWFTLSISSRKKGLLIPPANRHPPYCVAQSTHIPVLISICRCKRLRLINLYCNYCTPQSLHIQSIYKVPQNQPIQCTTQPTNTVPFFSQPIQSTTHPTNTEHSFQSANTEHYSANQYSALFSVSQYRALLSQPMQCPKINQ